MVARAALTQRAKEPASVPSSPAAPRVLLQQTQRVPSTAPALQNNLLNSWGVQSLLLLPFF